MQEEFMSHHGPDPLDAEIQVSWDSSPCEVTKELVCFHPKVAQGTHPHPKGEEEKDNKERLDPSALFPAPEHIGLGLHPSTAFPISTAHLGWLSVPAVSWEDTPWSGI